MSDGRVSVVIPAYNGGDWVERCVASALEQSELRECLVIDDCSSDDTVAIVRGAFAGEARLRLYRSPVNRGMGANHNVGLALAGGELVQVLHVDDRLLPGALARLAREFDDPRVALAYAPRRIEGADRDWTARYRRLETPMAPPPGITDGHAYLRRYLELAPGDNTIGEPSSVMLRRSVVLRAGGFRPELIQFIDMEMWLRMLALGAVSWVPEETAIRFQAPNNQTSRTLAGEIARTDDVILLASVMRDRHAPGDVRRRAAALWSREVWRLTRRYLRPRRAHDLAPLARHVARVLSPGGMRAPAISADPAPERLL